MSQARITIMLDKTIQAKLRDMQATKLKKTNQSVSFSSILNEVLAEAMGVKIN